MPHPSDWRWKVVSTSLYISWHIWLRHWWDVHAHTHTRTHARMYNTHTSLCHSLPPCTHGRDMLYVDTTLHVTTCLWNIYNSGLIGQVFVLTVSVYIESRYVQHLSKSPFHCSLTPPSHHPLPPQEALSANYPESRRVGSPEFSMHADDWHIHQGPSLPLW